MDLDERSNLLFGRHHAFRVYIVVAELSKPAFTTGEVVSLSGVDGPQVSRELKRLSSLGFVESTSNRGDYARRDGPFWTFIGDVWDAWRSDRSVSRDQTSPAAE